MQDERRREPDGSIFSRQSAPVSGTLPPERLAQLYWEELEGQVRGLVRVRGRPELRLLGLVPLMRFVARGPARFELTGGLLGSRGSLSLRLEDGVASVTVEGFRPRLPGPLYRVEEHLHVALSRRWLTRVAREAGAADADYNGAT